MPLPTPYPELQALPWAPRGSALGSSHGGRKCRLLAPHKARAGVSLGSRNWEAEARGRGLTLEAMEVEGWDSGNIKCSNSVDTLDKVIAWSTQTEGSCPPRCCRRQHGTCQVQRPFQNVALLTPHTPCTQAHTFLPALPKQPIMFPPLTPAVGPSLGEAGSRAPYSPAFLPLLLVTTRDKRCLLAQVPQNSLSQIPASAFSVSVDITPWSGLEAIRFLQLGGNETFAVTEWV